MLAHTQEVTLQTQCFKRELSTEGRNKHERTPQEKTQKDNPERQHVSQEERLDWAFAHGHADEKTKRRLDGTGPKDCKQIDSMGKRRQKKWSKVERLRKRTDRRQTQHSKKEETPQADKKRC
ncbi:hypothetical protein TRVL_04361 [Trypanosoma vivax]|nr:hypothetical protein TRVL_04361 [Trypanosoma vivax]